MMKLRICVVVALLVSIPAYSQTAVSGDQSGVWNSSGSPYLVTGDVTVPSGLSLTIEPGVEVIFQGHYKLIVNGGLQAVGTEADSIFFTTDSPSTGWGGIRIESGVLCNLAYCRIEYGKTSGSYPDNHGGGIALLSSNATVSHCVFADNDATGEDDGMGGAVYALSTNGSIFSDCIFTGNHAYGEGGAIKLTEDSNSEITNCLFIQNDCLYGGGAVSGYQITGTTVTGTLFAGNHTTYSGGGAIQLLGIGNTLFLVNCTISDNSATNGDGGGVFLSYGTGYFVNTIVYDNPGMYSNDVYLSSGGNAEAYYCDLDVSCGATGTNNFYEDPQFVDPAALDFNLLSTSSCIDTATDFFVLDGDTLVNLSPEQYCGTAPDIGAFEYCESGGIAETTPPQNQLFVLHGNSPNPFILNTTINYTLFEGARVLLEVFDLSGRKIQTLVSGFEPAGNQSVTWNGRDTRGNAVPSGVYVIRMQVGDTSAAVSSVLFE